MEPVDFYSSARQEEARQEILDLCGEMLPMPVFYAGLVLGEVEGKIREMTLNTDFVSSNMDSAAAMEVVDAYLC
jgi:hypothetical protein